MFCVSIPANDNKEYKVFFHSKEEKDEYYLGETSYCMDELRATYSAITKNDRNKAKDALNSKRLQYAMSVGYTSTKENVWDLKRT